jgi:hypothetical protein
MLTILKYLAIFIVGEYILINALQSRTAPYRRVKRNSKAKTTRKRIRIRIGLRNRLAPEAKPKNVRI